MEQETKMVFIAFASMTNYSNWKCQIALAANGRKIDEVGDFGDEIINRRYSPQSCQSYVMRSAFVKRN